MKTKLAFGALLLAANFLIGCGDDNDDIVFNPPQQQSRFRSVNAAALSGNIDVYVNGNLVGTNIPYTSATQFFTPNAGNNNIVVTATGNPNQVLATANPGLDVNQNYTGILLSNAAAASATAVFVADDNQPASTTSAELHLINGFQNAGDARVFIVPVGQSIDFDNPTRTVPFATVAEPLQLTAGNYQVFVTSQALGGLIFVQDSVTVTNGEDLILVLEPQTGATVSNAAAEVLAINEQSVTSIIESDPILLSRVTE
jgi:hypothetical protein